MLIWVQAFIWYPKPWGPTDFSMTKWIFIYVNFWVRKDKVIHKQYNSKIHASPPIYKLYCTQWLVWLFSNTKLPLPLPKREKIKKNPTLLGTSSDVLGHKKWEKILPLKRIEPGTLGLWNAWLTTRLSELTTQRRQLTYLYWYELIA